MTRIKIEKHELCVGVALPWAAYDEQGRMLLDKSDTIDSPSQLDALVEHGLYRDDNAPTPSVHDVLSPNPYNPFAGLTRIAFQLGQAFTALYARRATARGELTAICEGLTALYDRDDDAMLGAIHLLNKTPYTVWHAIDTALVAELLGRRLALEPPQRGALMAAALTSNIGMLKLQERLYKQSTPVTAEQGRQVLEHPQQSVEILRHAGIEDGRWLAAVLQHHERVNGTGYPKGLKAEALGMEAHIIGLADYYASLVSDRAYRSALSPFDALGDYLPERREEFDAGLLQHLREELGVYPPGTFVRLQNGETAVIIKRARGDTRPVACSFLSPRGEPYDRPFVRDCGDVDEFAVKAHCVPEAPVQFEPSVLWGYLPPPDRTPSAGVTRPGR